MLRVSLSKPSSSSLFSSPLSSIKGSLQEDTKSKHQQIKIAGAANVLRNVVVRKMMLLTAQIKYCSAQQRLVSPNISVKLAHAHYRVFFCVRQLEYGLAFGLFYMRLYFVIHFFAYH